jgi:hypothetical protein
MNVTYGTVHFNAQTKAAAGRPLCKTDPHAALQNFTAFINALHGYDKGPQVL